MKDDYGYKFALISEKGEIVYVVNLKKYLTGLYNSIYTKLPEFYDGNKSWPTPEELIRFRYKEFYKIVCYANIAVGKPEFRIFKFVKNVPEMLAKL